MPKHYLPSLLLGTLIIAGCAGVSPSAIVPKEPTAYIGIPKTSNPVVQAENESLEEFVVRIAGKKVSYSQPILIALTTVEDKENLWFGVSSERKDIQTCWIYISDSMQECKSEDMELYFKDQETPKIFFAFVYSNSSETLYVLDYLHYWGEQDPIDGYRLVLELIDDKWVEKSISQVY